MTTKAPEPLETPVTHLIMRTRPKVLIPLPEGLRARFDLVKPVPLKFYRFLYDAVGADYHWVDRKRMPGAKLDKEINDPAVDLYVLYTEGSPAGYAELDFRVAGGEKLAYFGLMAHGMGQGLGRPLLTYAAAKAFARGINALKVQTCSLDHPRALPLYESAGFEITGHSVETIRPWGKDERVAE